VVVEAVEGSVQEEVTILLCVRDSIWAETKNVTLNRSRWLSAILWTSSERPRSVVLAFLEVLLLI
jgi:hypothetical protein